MIFINEDEYRDCIGIYKITNKINNKLYIGKTEDRFIERFWNHMWKLNNNKHENKYLQNSWNKHGQENFEFEVVEICNETQNINKLEEGYIKSYNTFVNGYNLTLGGEGTKGNSPSEEAKRIVGEKNRLHNLGRKHKPETKLKMSKSHKGYVKSKEHRKNLSKALIGKVTSEETKQKLREINTGSNSPVTKLNEKNVYDIKQRLINKENQSSIAHDYKISLGAISAIANNRTWTHVNINGWDEYISSKKSKRRLSINEVKEIKILLKEGYNCSEIGRKYGVYPSTINNIKSTSFKNVRV